MAGEEHKPPTYEERAAWQHKVDDGRDLSDTIGRRLLDEVERLLKDQADWRLGVGYIAAACKLETLVCTTIAWEVMNMQAKHERALEACKAARWFLAECVHETRQPHTRATALDDQLARVLAGHVGPHVQ